MGILGNWLPEDPDKNAAARQALVAAGAAMMSGRGSFVGLLGEGLGVGTQAYQGALAQQQQDRLRKAQQQRWDLENEQHLAAIAKNREADAIIAGFGAPGSISGAAGVEPMMGGAPQGALDTAVFGPPPDLPRIGQPRRPPAIDSSLEGAPGAGGTMPSAFVPGEPPRRLPSLEELPTIKGAQPPRRTAASLEGVPMKGQPRPVNAAREAYERNRALAQRLLAGGHTERARPYQLEADKYKPEIVDTVPMRTTDGRRVMVDRYRDGSREEVEGYAPEPQALTWRDLGHETVGLDPEGKVVVRYKHGVSPGTQSYRGGSGAAGAGGGGRGAGSMKPMPAPALKMQQSELEALSTAQSIDADLAGVEQQITDKKLVFSPAANLWNQGLNAVGMSTEESRNFASFRAQMEKLRNDSLRLNAGVQTDGDAQRAWNELFANINDTELVKQRLAEIRKINARAAQLRRLNVDSIRSNYGHNGYDFSAYDKATTPPADAGGAPRPGTVDGGFRFKGGDPANKANWEKVR